MRTADDIFKSISVCAGETFSQMEMTAACKELITAPGDQAYILFLMVSLGYWDNSVADPFEVLRNARGNRALYIFHAVQHGWWNHSVVHPCKAILESQGTRISAIQQAIWAGWWRDIPEYRNKVTKHPEQLSNEFHITNTDNDHYDDIGYKSRRCGHQAYSSDNKPIPAISELFPVFVKRDEILKENPDYYIELISNELGGDIDIDNVQPPSE